jgi:hypothetical protein
VLIVWLSVALAVAPLAGCETVPQAPREIELAAIIIDSVRLARPEEADLAMRVLRGSQALPVRVPMALQPGDRVETARDAHAVIRWPSGSELYMRPGSGGVIGSLSDAIGEFFVKVRGFFAIETEFVKSGASGTAFLVRADPRGAVVVTVFDGEVLVESRLNAWPSVAMQAGTTAIAHPSAPQPVPASETEMRRTREWVERVERLVPSAPRTSSRGAAAVAIGVLITAILLSRGASDRDRRPSGETEPRPEVALAAPARPQPGTAVSTQAPSLTCGRGVTLAWQPVASAIDYVVQLETRTIGADGWQQRHSATTAATSSTTPGLQEGSYRWTVQARAWGTTGPAAGPMYFNCTVYLR